MTADSDALALVAWLHGCLDLDERAATAAAGNSIFDGTGIVTSHDRSVILGSHIATFIAEFDPARVLKEVQVKRRMIELHEHPHECSTFDRNGEVDNCTWCNEPEDCSTLRLLAEPYSDRPGYLDSWRPS